METNQSSKPLTLAELKAKLAAQGNLQTPAQSRAVDDNTSKTSITSAILSNTEKLNQEIEYSELSAKIQKLQDAILSANPTMPSLLREIHTTLSKQPDNITLLKEEEISVIVNGLMKKASLVLSTKVLKDKKKPVKGITVDDL